MISKRSIFVTILLGCVLLMYYSCTSSEHDDGESHPFEHTSVNDRVSQHNDSIDYSVSSSGTLDELKTIMISIHDTISFLIPERTSLIKSFPCGNCHTKPVEQLGLGREPTEKKAHWDIEIVHGSAEVMDCFTCHSKTKPDELVSLTGKSIVFDQSFKVCSQCHSSQFKDWVGGSHGKRLGGWAPPRIINTCVNCHNPHKPAFTSRWPSRLNTALQSKTNPED